MAKREDDEVYSRYIIPMNFENGSRLFGFVKFWNGVEAAVVCGCLGYFEYITMFSLGVSLNIFVGVICATVLPLGIFLLIGIEGTDLGRFALRMMKSIRSRKYLVRRENYNGVIEEKKHR